MARLFADIRDGIRLRRAAVRRGNPALPFVLRAVYGRRYWMFWFSLVYLWVNWQLEPYFGNYVPGLDRYGINFNRLWWLLVDPCVVIPIVFAIATSRANRQKFGTAEFRMLPFKSSEITAALLLPPLIFGGFWWGYGIIEMICRPILLPSGFTIPSWRGAFYSATSVYYEYAGTPISALVFIVCELFLQICGFLADQSVALFVYCFFIAGANKPKVLTYILGLLFMNWLVTLRLYFFLSDNFVRIPKHQRLLDAIVHDLTSATGSLLLIAIPALLAIAYFARYIERIHTGETQ